MFYTPKQILLAFGNIFFFNKMLYLQKVKNIFLYIVFVSWEHFMMPIKKNYLINRNC